MPLNAVPLNRFHNRALAAPPARGLLRLLAIGIPAVILAVGCAQERAPEHYRFFALGTEIELTVVERGRNDPGYVADHIHRRLQVMEEAWHPDGNGELARLNRRLAAGESMEVSPELASLLERGQSLETASEGLFNPAIGGLVRLWGFVTDTTRPRSPPDEEAVRAKTASSPRMADLVIDGTRIGAANPAVEINLGGYAKGYAAAHALDQLREAGIEAAVFNLGGDLVTLGRPDGPRGRLWRIGVRDPRSGEVVASIQVDGGSAVFTSGDYERGFEHDGEFYHHILDPRTGFPAGSVRSVTVVHDDPVLADAAATALFVAGEEGWEGLARRLGVEDVLIIGHRGNAWMTASMADRTMLEESITEAVIR